LFSSCARCTNWPWASTSTTSDAAKSGRPWGIQTIVYGKPEEVLEDNWRPALAEARTIMHPLLMRNRSADRISSPVD
jgi:hypothetical protein